MQAEAAPIVRKVKDIEYRLLPGTARQTRGMARLAQRVNHFAPRVGVQPGPLQVKELGFRCASSLAGGGLHFHWKCLMAPPKITDYIVVHELCHMHHRDHTDLFWNEDKVMPDYRERKEWLRYRGVQMDL